MKPESNTKPKPWEFSDTTTLRLDCLERAIEALGQTASVNEYIAYANAFEANVLRVETPETP